MLSMAASVSEGRALVFLGSAGGLAAQRSLDGGGGPGPGEFRRPGKFGCDSYGAGPATSGLLARRNLTVVNPTMASP